MIKPVNVVRQIQSQLLKRAKPPACNKFRPDHPECRFSNRVIIRATYHTQGTADLKALQKLINQDIIRLAATVCVNDLDIKKVPFNRRKRIMS